MSASILTRDPWRRRAGLVVLGLGLGLGAPSAAAPRPRLVVFEVEDAAPGGSVERATTLTDRVRARLGELGRFEVLPREPVEAAIRASGRSRCTFPLCQAQIIGGLGIELGLSVLLFRARRDECVAVARVFDRRTQPRGPVSSRVGPCDRIEGLVDEALDGLIAEPGVSVVSSPPPAPRAPDRSKALDLAREGRRLTALGRLDLARERLQACLRIEPLPSCHRSLGVLEAKAEHPDRALEHYRAYLALEPDAPDAAEVRAIIEAGSR